MSRKSNDELLHGELIATALCTIRQMRRMRTSEVAQAMGMPVRSYEHLESGKGRISFDRISRFAEATNSDAMAIVASAVLQSPEFALRCADNKLMTILMITLRDLNEELGNDITYIESGKIIGGYTRVMKELIDNVRNRDTFAETWLAERASVNTAGSVGSAGHKDKKTGNA